MTYAAKIMKGLFYGGGTMPVLPGTYVEMRVCFFRR